jgi:hypothetical protein
MYCTDDNPRRLMGYIMFTYMFRLQREKEQVADSVKPLPK